MGNGVPTELKSRGFFGGSSTDDLPVVLCFHWETQTQKQCRRNHPLAHSFHSFRCFFFRAAPAEYGYSQVGVESELQLPAYATTTSSAGSEPQLQPRSLTHWARPGVRPTSSWILVGFLTHWGTIGTPTFFFFPKERENKSSFWLLPRDSLSSKPSSWVKWFVVVPTNRVKCQLV